MAEKTKREKRVLVTGDVVRDYHIYSGARPAPDSKEGRGTMILDEPGGASLLYRIISAAGEQAKLSKKAAVDKAMAEAEAEKSGGKGEEGIKNAVAAAVVEAGKNFSEYSVSFGLEQDSIQELPAGLRSYAIWGPCPKENGSGDEVLRMVEPMGYGSRGGNSEYAPVTSEGLDSHAEIIVLDDAALGFRFDTVKHLWPRLIRDGEAGGVDWVVLKMSSPVAQGDLWRRLSQKFNDKLVVIASIGDIRREEVTITKGLSWEDTAQDMVSELKFNARIRDLTRCRHLIIHFNSDGALWVSNDRGTIDYRLIYDPANMEGEWSGRIKGRAFGYVSCLTAGVVNQLAMPHEQMDLRTGIISGLSSMRRLHALGHGPVGTRDPGFPYPEVATEIVTASTGYSVTEVPLPPKDISDPPLRWTIMEGVRRSGEEAARSFYGLGRRVALFGSRAFNNLPYAKFANFSTVDRSEIESLRSIRRLIKDYEDKLSPSKPLSIGVFGPPGSGKSFVVKQIARAALGKKVPVLEFNLSQFSGQEELIGAFHQVRDSVLEGKTPVVFWDEFDTNDLEWLHKLLAPMQDGEFREGQVLHPIGKCIFVFAGGTCFTMESFIPPADDSKESTERRNTFRKKKGTDFVSRLSGYLNVLGPNKRQKYDREKDLWVDDDNPVDVCFPVRRALLLRGVLGLDEDKEVDIDRGLLTAFLEIDKFEHGARSLETIALLTKRSGSEGLNRSDLPPSDQISLHVDYGKFMKLVNRDLLFKMESSKLAPAVHDFYRQYCMDTGVHYKYAMPFAELPEDIKADNMAAAERIPEVLGLAGVLVVPEDHLGTPVDVEFLKGDIETLAEAEHDGWMEQKIKSGWKYGTQRDDNKKVHDALISYKDLTEKDKVKDRNSVLRYPEIVKMAGYKIVHSD